MNRFLRNERGSTIVLAALTFPVMLSFAAFAVDLSNLYYSKSKLQAATDAAALGSVLSLPDSSGVSTKALSLVSDNTPSAFGTTASSQDVITGFWNATSKTFTPTSSNANAVEVVAHRTTANGNPVKTYFGNFVGAAYMDVNAHSVAVKELGTCVDVLDPSARNALHLTGNGNIQMNCPLQINSSDSQAAWAQGASAITTAKTCITGGYKGNGWSPTPQTGCPVLADPLAGVPEPAQPSANCTAPSGGGTMTSNCTYTGTVTIGGNTALQSGLFYFHNANVSIGGGANITGSGVTLFLDAGSTLSVSGNSTINVSAPLTGAYAGILIFQSRSTPASTTLSIWGDGSMTLNGSLYAPSCVLSLGGNSSLTLQVGYAIARQMSLGGSSNLVFGATGSGGAPRLLRVHANLVL